MDTQFYFYNNKKIAFTTSGTGNVLVLLHGFMESQKIWIDFTKVLSQKYKVVTFDLPGHGDSECINETHTMCLMADCVKAGLDYLAVDKCVLIGHSMGGYAALSFAKSYPQMLNGLGLFHSHAYADTDEAKHNRDRSCQIVKQNRANFIANFIPELFAPENVAKYQKEIIQLQQYVKDMSVEAIVAAQQGMKLREPKLDVIKEAKYPMLFIFGKQDSRTPLPKTLELTVLAKHSETLIIDVGHMGYIEARNETLQTIDCFTDKCYK